MSATAIAPHSPPLWSPLRNARFRELWLANAISNLGTWMQGMGAAWLMIQLSSSPQMVASVQTAMTLPVFLLVIPAGLLADRCDRPTFLLVTHVAMALFAICLSAVVWTGNATAEMLLVGTFLIGCGAAMTMPAWQAAVSALVEPDEIHSAATLNGMSFNFARTAGPAVAGVIAQIAAVAFIFWINALSFVVLAFVFWRWRCDQALTIVPKEPAAGPLSSAFSVILRENRFVALLARTFIIFFGASGIWSLLPAYAGLELRMDATVVGLLMATIGAGALAGGFLLPPMKSRFGIDRLTFFAAIQLAIALLLAAWNPTDLALWISMVLTGVGWAFIVSGLNGTAQGMFPVGIRARAISIYLMAMYGGTSAGSWAWGTLSLHYGLTTTFVIAGIALLIGATLASRWSIT